MLSKTKVGKRYRKGNSRANYKVTKERVQRLKILQRYRYITTTFMHRLIPLDDRITRDGFVHFMSEMRDVSLIEKPEAARWTSNSLYKDDTYQITLRGNNALKRADEFINFPRDAANLFHDQCTSLFAAALEIKCIEHDDLEYFNWWDICQSPKIPKDTVESSTPHNLQVHGTPGIQDYAPFAIGHSNKKRIFFLGIETDMKTEQRSNATQLSKTDRATLEKKFKFWMDVLKFDVYRSHYGFPNAYIVFLFITEGSMRSAMGLFEELYPQGSAKVLFQHVPYHRGIEESYKVEDFTPDVFYRVGHPDFDIVSHLDKK